MAKITREDLNRLTGRQRLRYIQRQRETRIFSGLIVIMTLLLVFGVLIGYGVIKVPFWNGFNEKVVYVSDGDVPCPKKDSKYVPLKDLKVTVLNGTDRHGLARTAADGLKANGVKVVGVGNYPAPQVLTHVEVETNSENLAAAYTVAALFDNSKVIYRQVDQSKTGITVILNENFESVRPKDTVAEKLQHDIKNPDKCLPVNPNAPAPVPAPEPKKKGKSGKP